MARIDGHCHCGNIAFRYETSKDDVPLRTCECDYCSRQNPIYTADPNGSLTYHVKSETDLHRYNFGHKTADFFICKSCGIYPFILSEIEGKTYAIVNLCATGDRAIYERELTKKDFEGEATSDRLARRSKTWIGSVTRSDTPLA